LKIITAETLDVWWMVRYVPSKGQYVYNRSVYFLAKTVAEPFGSDQTLI